MNSDSTQDPETAKSTRSGKRENAALTRERILQAAIGLIDAGGLSALNMRDLGQALGASTMAVYRHFRNKTDLLDAVIDDVVGMFEPTGVQGTWQAKAKIMSCRVREAMLAHPELAELIGREFRRSPTSLRVNAHMIEVLSEAGIPDALLAEAYWSISSYTTGYALLEAQALRRQRQSSNFRPFDARVRKLSEILQQVEGISPRGLSLASEVLAHQLDDHQFLFGLECLVSGLAARISHDSDVGHHNEA